MGHHPNLEDERRALSPLFIDASFWEKARSNTRRMIKWPSIKAVADFSSGGKIKSRQSPFVHFYLLSSLPITRSTVCPGA